MRRAFHLAFAANLVLDAAMLLLLPARVARHFGPDGLPDAWTSDRANAAGLLGLQILLFAVGVLALQANLARPVRLPAGWFLAAFGVFVLYAVWWVIALHRAFRLPPAAQASGDRAP